MRVSLTFLRNIPRSLPRNNCTTDRLAAAPANHNCIVKIIIRVCDTDARVCEESFYIQAESREEYCEQIEDLHQLIGTIVASYTVPVYVTERVVELTTGIPRAQRRLQ